MQHYGSRIFGLDLMRSIAILLVLYSHADDLLDAYWPRNPGAMALDGVTVFFVLSGYLIGNILLRMVQPSPISWWRRILDFWQRRWLRTLPNYYLFLLLNIALLYFGLAPGILNINALAYFAFLQNPIFPLDLFFWESWSLAVEEWFYLLFPVLLVFTVATLRFSARWGSLLAVATMIVFSTLLRFPASRSVDTSFMLDLLVRKIVVMRFDAIGYGVLMAWAMWYMPSWISRYRIPLFIIGLIGLSFTVVYTRYASIYYNGTWHCTISALTMAMLLPLLVQWKTFRWSVPITFISLVSYAVYLVHMPLRNFFLVWVEDQRFETTVFIYLGYYFASFAVSGLVYRYWELPFMKMRGPLSTKLLRVTPSS